eukprot:Transcript_10970.p1 GENE.Transcript_10970~~Transcript_10970.p1  ORF type:complete len:477 (-),score=225.75 Transcript_10970:116-1546(-)
MPATRRASKSPARERPGAATPPKKKAKSVTWNVEQSPLMVVINNYLVPVLIMISTPYLAYIVTYITDMEEPTLTKFMNKIYTEGGLSVNAEILKVLQPTAEAATLLLVFNFVALLIYWWPGKTEYGPVTINGHQPEYADNGVAHSVLFTLSFLAGSDLFLGWYKLSVLYDHFPATIGALNFFGLAFCAFLYAKGRYFPSGPDSGTSGHGPCFDYYWGMELYPRVGGVDVKKFVNCRFSMTYWMLAGVSFVAASYEKHGIVDPGLLLCALSQFLYLCKFYVWEIGYMRSIDIIVDRAGFYETWGCLVWVPAVYTLHTRTAVNLPSGLSWPAALLIFAVGILGVGLNFWADDQRQRFRAKKGDCLIWGRKPVYIEAQYATVNPSTGAAEKHTSLLLASGWWGTARHNQYLFELTAAYSWGFLAGVHTHGLLPLFYPVFLTILLVHRAHRDEEKCLAKYGKYYEKYMDMVPYKIVPFVY